MSYYLPASIGELVEKQKAACKNLRLILDKYVPKNVIEESKNKGNYRSEWLRDLTQSPPLDEKLAKSVYQRWLERSKAMRATIFRVELHWRMVVGLGGNGVLETDLTLSHLYGIPSIPGSALKGLMGAYARKEKVPDDKTGKVEKQIQTILGTKEQAGTVLFFDAMPVDGKASLVVDIMNSHYPNYYGGRGSPTNDQHPNPITFLAVEDTTFVFALAPRRPKDQGDVEQAIIWLKDALQNYGIGGKTSAGYGYFSESREQEASVEPTTQEITQQLTEPKSESRLYERPRIPHFYTGQKMNGVVVPSTEELRELVPEASAFLRYESFPLKDVLIIVSSGDIEGWTVGNTRNCSFLHEETRHGCTLLFCQPRASKKKKEK